MFSSLPLAFRGARSSISRVHFSTAKNNKTPATLAFAKSLNDFSLEESVDPVLSKEHAAYLTYVSKYYKIEEKLGTNYTNLIRQNGDEKITIKIDCQAFTIEPVMPSEVTSETTFEDIDVKMKVGFIVEIEKEGKGSLVFNLFGSDKIELGGVNLFPVDTDRNNLSLYTGPDLNYFKTGTNEAFLKFLAARKINSKMAQFLTKHVQIKDLARFKTFVTDVLDHLNA